jgi:predicted DNA-binding transcriptional regulator YafY
MRKATANTLAHLLGAMSGQRSVTIRYVKENGEVSRRRIDIYSVQVTKAGNVTLTTWDHRDQELTTFRLDRITHYTLHRSAKLTAYAHPVVADTEPIIDADTDEIAGFSAWDDAYKLAA